MSLFSFHFPGPYYIWQSISVIVNVVVVIVFTCYMHQMSKWHFNFPTICLCLIIICCFNFMLFSLVLFVFGKTNMKPNFTNDKWQLSFNICTFLLLFFVIITLLSPLRILGPLERKVYGRTEKNTRKYQ